jgi:hypothetical protein
MNLTTCSGCRYFQPYQGRVDGQCFKAILEGNIAHGFRADKACRDFQPKDASHAIIECDKNQREHAMTPRKEQS